MIPLGVNLVRQGQRAASQLRSKLLDSRGGVANNQLTRLVARGLTPTAPRTTKDFREFVSTRGAITLQEMHARFPETKALMPRLTLKESVSVQPTPLGISLGDGKRILPYRTFEQEPGGSLYTVNEFSVVPTGRKRLRNRQWAAQYRPEDFQRYSTHALAQQQFPVYTPSKQPNEQIVNTLAYNEYALRTDLHKAYYGVSDKNGRPIVSPSLLDPDNPERPSWQIYKQWNQELNKDRLNFIQRLGLFPTDHDGRAPLRGGQDFQVINGTASPDSIRELHHDLDYTALNDEALPRLLKTLKRFGLVPDRITGMDRNFRVTEAGYQLPNLQITFYGQNQNLAPEFSPHEELSLLGKDRLSGPISYLRKLLEPLGVKGYVDMHGTNITQDDALQNVRISAKAVMKTLKEVEGRYGHTPEYQQHAAYLKALKQVLTEMKEQNIPLDQVRLPGGEGLVRTRDLRHRDLNRLERSQAVYPRVMRRSPDQRPRVVNVAAFEQRGLPLIRLKRSQDGSIQPRINPDGVPRKYQVRKPSERYIGLRRFNEEAREGVLKAIEYTLVRYIREVGSARRASANSSPLTPLQQAALAEQDQVLNGILALRHMMQRAHTGAMNSSQALPAQTVEEQRRALERLLTRTERLMWGLDH